MMCCVHREYLQEKNGAWMYPIFAMVHPRVHHNCLSFQHTHLRHAMYISGLLVIVSPINGRILREKLHCIDLKCFKRGGEVLFLISFVMVP